MIIEDYAMQNCNVCEQDKPLDMFGVNKATPGTVNYKSRKSSAIRTICKECEAHRSREFRKQHKNYRGSGKIKSVPEEHRIIMSAIRSKISQAKSNNKRTDRDFNITDQYIYELWLKQNNRCIYTNEEFVIEKYHNANLSIDKIVPDLGYVEGNIQLVCWAVNRAKGDLSHDVFLKMCGIIHERATTIPTGSTLK